MKVQFKTIKFTSGKIEIFTDGSVLITVNIKKGFDKVSLSAEDIRMIEAQASFNERNQK